MLRGLIMLFHGSRFYAIQFESPGEAEVFHDMICRYTGWSSGLNIDYARDPDDMDSTLNDVICLHDYKRDTTIKHVVGPREIRPIVRKNDKFLARSTHHFSIGNKYNSSYTYLHILTINGAIGGDLLIILNETLRRRFKRKVESSITLSHTFVIWDLDISKLRQLFVFDDDPEQYLPDLHKLFLS
jgi:hypothetical protein